MVASESPRGKSLWLSARRCTRSRRLCQLSIFNKNNPQKAGGCGELTVTWDEGGDENHGHGETLGEGAGSRLRRQTDAKAWQEQEQAQ